MLQKMSRHAEQSTHSQSEVLSRQPAGNHYIFHLCCVTVLKMGSGRDKRKKAKPKAPGAGAEKTSRKTEKNEGKAVKRAAKAAKVATAL